MLLSFAIAVAVAGTTSTASPSQARAFVRIERPAIATADRWKSAAGPQKRERVILDERGEQRLLRLFEYE